MVNNTSCTVDDIFNAFQVFDPNITIDHEMCQRTALFLHNWSIFSVAPLTVALAAIVILCSCLAACMDDIPENDPEPILLLQEDSARGRKGREKWFVHAAGAFTASCASAYILVLVLEFSRFCTKDDVFIDLTLMVSVPAWISLPLGALTVANLARDVWTGKRAAKAERVPWWAGYMLPALVSGWFFLGVVKVIRAIVYVCIGNKGLATDTEVADAAESSELLLPRYAEIDEAADGQEQAAGGAWC
ncbi:hypothetical protein MMC18_003958 [Xylographa bjoerkii]|nr:hypothetical protein [Xylographa bjoerkii]